MTDYRRYLEQPKTPPVLDIPKALSDKLSITLEEATKRLECLDEELQSFTDFPTLPVVSEFPLVSTEGFGETLKVIWETIKKWFKKVISWFKEMTNEARIETEVIRFKANNLKIHTRNEMLKTVGKNNSLIMNTHVAAMSVFYNQPKDISMFISWLNNHHNVVKEYLKYVDKVALGGLRELNGSIASLDPTNTTNDDINRKIINPIEKISPSVFVNSLGEIKSISQTTKLGPQMLGNVRLKIDLPEQTHSAIRRLNEYKIGLTTAETTPKAMPPQFAIPRFSLLNSDQLIDRILKLCDILDESVRVNEQRNSVIERTITSMDRFVDKTYKYSGGSPTVKESAEQLLRLSKQVTQWATPLPGVFGTSLRAMRGGLILCEKNIK